MFNRVPIQIDPECKEGVKKLDGFFNDPMTVEYGVFDCADLVVKAHVKKCAVCKSFNDAICKSFNEG